MDRGGQRPHRFYVDSLAQSERQWIEGDEARHIAKVLRLTSGDEIVIFDGSGWDYRATIVEVERNRVRIRTEGRERPDRELAVEIAIAFAIPKGKRSDWLVEKCAELGAAELVPIETRYSVVRIDDSQMAHRLSKWQRSCVEASKQCGRSRVTQVRPVIPFDQLLGLSSESDLALLASPSPEAKPLREALCRPGTPSKVIAAIGPEGGFCDDEVQAARSAGWQQVSLGPAVLRVETAAVAMLACIGQAYHGT